MPEQEVISTASSLDITYWDSPRDGDCTPSLSLSSSASLWLHVALRPISGSEEPVCGASHNRGCRGSRVPALRPRRSINISQIRLQKNTVFIQDLCKLWRRVSLSLHCVASLSFSLSAFCVRHKFAYFRLKRVIDLHINRAGWWGVWCFQMWNWNYTNCTEAVIWFHNKCFF